MAERPILFSGEMVRAILAGRKSQTRRVIKHPEYYGCPTGDCPHEAQCECDAAMNHPEVLADCPYGAPGDRLWVRETWAPMGDHAAIYQATNYGYAVKRWRPSIFMPRWASRITLELTGVRVERVQEISYGDVIAEGLAEWLTDEQQTDTAHRRAAVEAYGNLWNRINGKRYPWASNPWVWVLEFKRI